MSDLPPHDIDAEEACIAALLVAPESLDAMAVSIGPGDFFRERHGWIFAAAQAVANRTEGVNVITVAHELTRRGHLVEAGGLTFLNDLVRRLPVAMGAEWYAGIVADQSKRRKLISLASRIAVLAAENPDPEAVADIALDQLIRAGVDGKRPLTRKVADVLAGGVADEIVALVTEADHAKPIGLSTGYPALDALIDGLVPGNFVPLLADTGMGKSFLLANIARHLALAGHRTHIVSTEVTARELVSRDVWMDAGIDPYRRRFSTGFSEADVRETIEAIGRVGEWGERVYIADRPGISLEELRAEVRRVKQRWGTDVLMLDHLGHITVKAQERRREMEIVCRAAKELAVTEDVPVLAVAHVNREAQKLGGGKITYNDGKDSSAIEQEADRVLTMYAIDANGEPLPRDIAQAWRKNHGYQLVRIDAGKHRSGPSSYITLKLMWPLGGRFVDHTAGVPA